MLEKYMSTTDQSFSRNAKIVVAAAAIKEEEVTQVEEGEEVVEKAAGTIKACPAGRISIQRTP